MCNDAKNLFFIASADKRDVVCSMAVGGCGNDSGITANVILGQYQDPPLLVTVENLTTPILSNCAMLVSGNANFADGGDLSFVAITKQLNT